jgi:3'(2'), 5'-bisphosphate nucleotidase
MRPLEHELAVARAAAEEAGLIILGHYDRETLAAEKSDRSPVTEADLAANALLVARLQAAFPRDEILSEEGGRVGRGARRWLVDPLDGTRDFVERSGDFAVHVGLVEDGAPLLGVVHVPVARATFTAVRGGGAFRDGVPVAASRAADPATFRAAVGRFAVPENVQRFLADAPFAGVVQVGASVKLMELAEGALEVCLWLHGREHVWDTCAPAVIVAEAGGRVTDIDGASLVYGDDTRHARGVVASNGTRHDEVLRLARPWFRP